MKKRIASLLAFACLITALAFIPVGAGPRPIEQTESPAVQSAAAHETIYSYIPLAAIAVYMGGTLLFVELAMRKGRKAEK